jgi:GTP cyclohydrolase I
MKNDLKRRIAIERSTRDMLSSIEPPIIAEELRPGLLDTPRRVAQAWMHWSGGYDVDVPGLFTTFDDGAQDVDEMVVVRNIPFYSHCEHHLAPFFGTATVAYIPDGRIVGLSKLSRVVDAYARRLQVQERMTTQIAEAVWQNLHPLGVGVRVRARHLCMESRGICQQGHDTTTTALRGVFRDDPAARAEFIGACGS